MGNIILTDSSSVTLNKCRDSTSLRPQPHPSKSFPIIIKAEGKRPLGRPGRWCVDGTKVDLRDMGWDGMDWIDLTQDRDRWRALVSTVINLRVP
jgi:hypothetical protein